VFGDRENCCSSGTSSLIAVGNMQEESGCTQLGIALLILYDVRVKGLSLSVYVIITAGKQQSDERTRHYSYIPWQNLLDETGEHAKCGTSDIIYQYRRQDARTQSEGRRNTDSGLTKGFSFHCHDHPRQGCYFNRRCIIRLYGVEHSYTNSKNLSDGVQVT